jgi:sarcosine oxidase/L-pipecolate oxidase
MLHRQSLASIQLTPEEHARYAKVPVVSFLAETSLSVLINQILNIDIGWYIFPPNPQGLIKMAIHGAGYTNPLPIAGEGCAVSVPRTKLTPGAEDGMIPKTMLARLREGLAEVYPEFAEREFVSTRLCW